MSVRHYSFFTALGELPEGSADFEMLGAGLLVLRLLDRWPNQATPPRASVKHKIESLADGPCRRVLSDLVDAISDSRIPKLIVFAQLLEQDGHFRPAADVYATAIELIASRPIDRDLIPLCIDRRAYCLRQIGDHDPIPALYEEGIAVARALEATTTSFNAKKAALIWILRLRISNAVYEMERGNLPHAEHELDAIIRDAEGTGIADLVARATHERGQVAYRRDDDELAATLFFRAAVVHVDPGLARRAELDLAVALSDLGHIDYARTICEIVRDRPEQRGFDQRPLAGINLMRLAHMRGDRGSFDRLREELGHEKMSGRLRAYYHLTVGQGLQRFGEADAARAAFLQTIEVAQAFRVYELVIKAETLLRASENEQAKPRRIPQRTEALVPILEAIDQRREPFAGAKS